MAIAAIPYESFRDSLSTITKEGGRAWLYPRKPKGRLYRQRTFVSIILLILFFGWPLVKINGHPLMLFQSLPLPPPAPAEGLAKDARLEAGPVRLGARPPPLRSVGADGCPCGHDRPRRLQLLGRPMDGHLRGYSTCRRQPRSHHGAHRRGCREAHAEHRLPESLEPTWSVL